MKDEKRKAENVIVFAFVFRPGSVRFTITNTAFPLS